MKKLTLFTLLGLAIFISGCANNTNTNENTNTAVNNENANNTVINTNTNENTNINRGNTIQPVTPGLNVNTNTNTNENINEPVIVGGGCEYKSIAGTAKILSIDTAPADGYNCPQDPKVIRFEFTPTDPAAKSAYLFPNVPDIGELRINSGLNPSLKWVTTNKVTVGKVYQVQRLESTAGTCTPVTFKFSEVNLFPATGCN